MISVFIVSLVEILLTLQTMFIFLSTGELLIVMYFELKFIIKLTSLIDPNLTIE